MKTFKADTGKVFVEDWRTIRGIALYTPDDYDGSRLSQITEAEAEALRSKQEQQKMEIDEERQTQSFRIAPGTIRSLDYLARTLGISQSEIIDQLVERAAREVRDFEGIQPEL